MKIYILYLEKICKKSYVPSVVIHCNKFYEISIDQEGIGLI